MSPKFFASLMVWCLLAVTLPPVVTALMNRDVLVSGLDHLGYGFWGTVIGTAAAAAYGIGFGAYFHALLKGGARLHPTRRRKVFQSAVFGTILLLASSALPTVQQLGGGTAEKMEAHAIATQLRKASDKVKVAIEAFNQLGPVLENKAAKFDDLQRTEALGLLSGRLTEGVVALTIASHAKRFRQVESSRKAAQERIPELIARLDDAIQRFIEASGDMEKSAQERAVAKQKSFDDARNALVSLTQTVPVAALLTFVSELTSEQVRPVYSANPEIREKQEAALGKVESELRRAAYDLNPRVVALARAMKIEIPVYEWRPQSLLVLVHWYGIIQFWAVAIGLDLIPILTIFLAARLHDGVMGWDDDDDDGGPSPVSGRPRPSEPLASSGSPLGPHPHPRATAARVTTPDKIREDA